MDTRTRNEMESFANRLAKPIANSVHDVFLAGLGAFALTRKESEKLMAQGSELFEQLVAEGEKFEQRAQKRVRRETAQATTRVKQTFGLAKPPIAYHLLPDGEGWTVRLEGSQETITRHYTKDEALDAAREIAHAHLPSRLVVHRADGTVQTNYTYE